MSSTLSVPRVTKLPRRHRSSQKHQRYFSSKNTSLTNTITPTNDNKASSANQVTAIKPSHSVIKVHRCQQSAPESTDHKCQMSVQLHNDQSGISFSAWSSRKLSTSNIYENIEGKKRHKRRSGFHCCCSPMCLCLSVFAGLLVTMAITALLVSLLMKSNTTSTSTSTSRSSVFNVNLLINGDGEIGSCDTNGSVMQPTAWNYNGTISQIRYNSSASSAQTFATPGPNDRGQCYFNGQVSASTTMWQTIDLSNYVDSLFIDSHIVNYNLSAWLGGFSNQDDNVIVSLIFADQYNQTIGSGVSIGPVLAIDRGSQTSLLFRQTNGLVPVGTRFLTVLVTITRSSGTRIGFETARALAATNAHVFITARDMNKGAEVIADIKKTTGNNKVEVLELDLTSLKSVRTFVDQFRARKLHINILICNAGIMACPYAKTKDGYESQFGVNHLAHFLLVTSLIPELKAGQPARVVMVSSVANKFGGINFDDLNWEKSYDKWLAYGQSKTANILFAKQFNKLYASQGIQDFSLHPGGIMTNLQKDVPVEEQKAMGFFKEDGTLADIFKNIEQGASTSVYAALAPELDGHGGEYLEDCAINREVNEDKSYYVGIAPHSLDMKAAERLWNLSEQMVAAK